jgi:hypothetical protein
MDWTLMTGCRASRGAITSDRPYASDAFDRGDPPGTDSGP